MSTTRLKNITNDALSVNAPEGHPDSHLVEPGEVLQVPGDSKETDDAYIVGKGDDARAYPKAIWKREAQAKSSSKKEGERS